MDSTDLQAPCNCGALGDHLRNPNCAHTSMVELEVAGRRSSCLEVIGFLRTGYDVDITHEWQDPTTEEWAFKFDAYRKPMAPLPTVTVPERPTPDVAVLACLADPLGVEMSENDLHLLTGIDQPTLTNTLTTLVNAGQIVGVRPGFYRKDA
ncbi:hypothetical protein [Streptomyces rubiginosohelvolus]|uniref:hypothetical protein n=1 Tax=Streptomyces rubiginosohelvolus TaxID=67362 RepID=UPI0034078C22